MKSQKIEKFSEIDNLLQCPLCGEKIHYSEGSLICENNHCFDIAAKGYVNFVPHQKASEKYSKNFFQNRRAIFNEGFYDHILGGIKQLLASHQGLEQIIDVGCGEGYYSHRLQDAQQKPIIAFDISKEAIQTAAQGVNGICWLVADITNIPLQSDCSDCILDVFTPSNYGEFSRLLKDDGLLIKVIPGENHLIELRHAAKGLIQRDSYSNESVVDYFKQHFKTEDQLFLSKTIPVNPEQLKKLWQMTPLLFGVSDKDLDALKVSEITIEAQVLVGSKI